MKKISKIPKNLLPFLVLILLAILSFLFLYGFNFQKNNFYDDKVILFYGDGCSHCVTVDKFISNNKVKEKVEFIELEVFNNLANASILADKVQICGLDSSHVGVPFLWDNNDKKCVVGYADVISFFQDRIGHKKP